LKIIPITINYERVYEGEAFPFELTGEARSFEKLKRMRLGMTAFGKKYGRVFVNFSKPLSFRDFIHTQEKQAICEGKGQPIPRQSYY
jgi:glycerol-3-phosphate O-acyltransferase